MALNKGHLNSGLEPENSCIEDRKRAGQRVGEKSSSFKKPLMGIQLVGNTFVHHKISLRKISEPLAEGT